VAEALRRAEQRRREGVYLEASRLVECGLALDPDNITAHLLLAYLYAARRATASAKEEFRWVLSRDPNHARALLGLARVALEEGDVRTCHDLLKRALRFYPEFPEASALLEAVLTRPAQTDDAEEDADASRVTRLRMPGAGRALIVGRADGGLLSSQPVTDDAKDVAEALGRMLRLATVTLARAGLGSLHRAVIVDPHDAVFTRTDGEIIVSLALPRATDTTQGLLDVNRLWAAAMHELGLSAAPAATPSTPAGAAPAVTIRRVS
jgi:tetratricopeptide (TPR) repeat protein